MVVIAGAAITTMLSGCSTEPTVVPPDPGPSPVSAEGYRSAFDDFVGCMTEHGYVVDGPTLNPVDQQRLLYVADPGSGDAEKYDENYVACSAPLGVAEGGYVATSDAVMADSLREAVYLCMSRAGYDVRDATNYREMLEALSSQTSDEDSKAAEISLNDCISSAAGSLYPDLPFISLG